MRPTGLLTIWTGRLLRSNLSFLNEKPAGKHGFVKAKGDSLVFADGTPARFWGANLTAYTLFGNSREATCQQAKRLSALGFNLVRLHHHDSTWVNPNIFGNSKSVKDTQRINAEMQDRIDTWIKCLKDEGIYVWLDLHVGRGFKADDNIYGFDEIRKGKEFAELKGYNYVNITIQQAMKRFAEAYVTHVNPHTGLAYKDEPAIMAMQITNENDITNHFGNSLLPDKNVPQHNRLYMGEAKAFSRLHNLPEDKVWRSWEHGPSKLFLNDMERRFNVEMIDHLRKLGVKVPIATTNTWGANPLSSLPALTSGDIIDAHSYGGIGQLEKNPLFASGLIHWIGAAQVAGKPLTVTEWNAEPFPTPGSPCATAIRKCFGSAPRLGRDDAIRLFARTFQWFRQSFQLACLQRSGAVGHLASCGFSLPPWRHQGSHDDLCFRPWSCALQPTYLTRKLTRPADSHGERQTHSSDACNKRVAVAS